ncbi:hypothetical protein JAO85_20645 [Comamonas sp. NyZ500]|uniref:hypothetical protein n=1 Tax=Comamonas sp. NyZ500 TaxID=2795732 RepID=UPI00192ACD05|nr:hypothetical protein [Comamonas sp. NyZ500]MBL5979691.1 hypothetical protein [Comamonas sp. NyZ500]
MKNDIKEGVDKDSKSQEANSLSKAIEQMASESNIFSPSEAKTDVAVSKVQTVVELEAKSNNVDKLAEAVTILTKEGLSTWNNHIEKKAEASKIAAANEESQHKRTVMVLVYLLTLFFGLLLTTIIKEQYEMSKLLLTSGLAVSAGVGLNGLFKKKSEN